MHTRFISTIALLSLGLTLSLTSGACGGDAKKKENTTAATARVIPAAEEEVEDDEEEESFTESSADLQDVVYFQFDSSELSSTARERLEENADWLKEDSARRITIEGHTDEAGTTGYNLALGERRARVTKDYLLRLGIESSRVRIVSYGEEKPASNGDDSLNRRSVFVATRK